MRKSPNINILELKVTDVFLDILLWYMLYISHNVCAQECIIPYISAQSI
jgi:hypothetical protein